MAGCEAIIYNDVSEATLNCLSESIEGAFGLALSGPSGTASAMGTALSWSHDAATSQLTLTCEARPVFLSCADIYAHLGKMLERCRDQTPATRSDRVSVVFR